MDENQNHREEVHFYFFWKWEYSRRNSEYVEEFEKLIQILEQGTFFAQRGLLDKENDIPLMLIDEMNQDGKVKDAIDAFNKKFTFGITDDCIRSPYFGFKPDNILKGILNKSLSFSDEQFLICNIYEIKKIISTMGVERKTMSGAPKLSVDIDTLKSLEDIKHAIAFYREQNKEIRTETFSALYDALFYYLKKSNVDCFTTQSNHSRSVGLWIWQYIQENNLFNDKQKNAKAKNALLYDYFSNKLTEVEFNEFKFLHFIQGKKKMSNGYGWSPSGSRRFRDFYECTHECIDKMEVLPIA